jgi:hypothetical protein
MLLFNTGIKRNVPRMAIYLFLRFQLCCSGKTLQRHHQDRSKPHDVIHSSLPLRPPLARKTRSGKLRPLGMINALHVLSTKPEIVRLVLLGRLDGHG